MLTIIELGKSTTNKNVEYNKVFFFALSQFEFADWSRIDHVDHISINSSNREKSPRELVALLC